MELNNKISIYVPSTYDGNKSAKMMQKRETKRVAKYFCSYFGGATESKANGYYTSPTKGLIKESQNIVYSACTEEDMEMHKSKVFAYAKRLCRRMVQEAITIEINNNMYFITAE